jgi:hypothetical protein
LSHKWQPDGQLLRPGHSSAFSAMREKVKELSHGHNIPFITSLISTLSEARLEGEMDRSNSHAQKLLRCTDFQPLHDFSTNDITDQQSQFTTIGQFLAFCHSSVERADSTFENPSEWVKFLTEGFGCGR